MSSRENSRWRKLYTSDARAFLGHTSVLERYLLIPLDLNAFHVKAIINTVEGENILNLSSAGHRFDFKPWSEENKPSETIIRAGKIFYAEMEYFLKFIPIYEGFKDQSPLERFTFPPPPNWAPPPPASQVPRWKENEVTPYRVTTPSEDSWMNAAKDIEAEIHMEKFHKKEATEEARSLIPNKEKTKPLRIWNEFIPAHPDQDVTDHYEGYCQGPDDPLTDPTGKFDSTKRITVSDLMVKEAEHALRKKLEHLIQREKEEKEEELENKLKELKHTAVFKTLDKLCTQYTSEGPATREEIYMSPKATTSPKLQIVEIQDEKTAKEANEEHIYEEIKEKEKTKAPHMIIPYLRPTGELQKHSRMDFNKGDTTMNNVEKEMWKTTNKKLKEILYNQESSSDESSVFEDQESYDIGPDRRRKTSEEKYDDYITDLTCDLTDLTDEISDRRMGSARLKRFIDHKIVELDHLMRLLNSSAETRV